MLTNDRSAAEPAVTANIQVLMQKLEEMRVWYEQLFAEQSELFSSMHSTLRLRAKHKPLSPGTPFKRELAQELEFKEDHEQLLLHISVDLVLYEIKEEAYALLDSLLKDKEAAFSALSHFLSLEANDDTAFKINKAASYYAKFFHDQIKRHKEKDRVSLIWIWEQHQCNKLIEQALDLTRQAHLTVFLNFSVLRSELSALQSKVKSSELSQLTKAVEGLKLIGGTYHFTCLSELSSFQNNFANSSFTPEQVTRLAEVIALYSQHLGPWVRYTRLMSLLNDEAYKAFFDKAISSLAKNQTMNMSKSPQLMTLASLVNDFFTVMDQYSHLLNMDDFLDYVHNRSQARVMEQFYHLSCHANPEDLCGMIEALEGFKPHFDTYFNQAKPRKASVPSSVSPSSSPALRPAKSFSPTTGKDLRIVIEEVKIEGEIKLIPEEKSTTLARTSLASPEEQPETANNPLRQAMKELRHVRSRSFALPTMPLSSHQRTRSIGLNAFFNPLPTIPSDTSVANSPKCQVEAKTQDSPRSAHPPSDFETLDILEEVTLEIAPVLPRLRQLIQEALSDAPYWKNKVNYYNKWLWPLPGKSLKVNNQKCLYPDIAADIKKIVDIPSFSDEEVYRALDVYVEQLSAPRLFGRESVTQQFYKAIAWLLENRKHLPELFAKNDVTVLSALKTVETKGGAAFTAPRVVDEPDLQGSSWVKLRKFGPF